MGHDCQVETVKDNAPSTLLREEPVNFVTPREQEESEMDNSIENEVSEVVELSNLMRADPTFDHVRAVCRSLNLSPEDLLLVQLIGGEDLFTTGVLFEPVLRRTWHFYVGDYSLEVKVSQVDDPVDLDNQDIDDAVIRAALLQL